MSLVGGQRQTKFFWKRWIATTPDALRIRHHLATPTTGHLSLQQLLHLLLHLLLEPVVLPIEIKLRNITWKYIYAQKSWAIGHRDQQNDGSSQSVIMSWLWITLLSSDNSVCFPINDQFLILSNLQVIESVLDRQSRGGRFESLKSDNWFEVSAPSEP